ncbi:MAG: 3-isopropylmalate dehydratase small subunit [Nitrospinota bacterium]|nr:MAG: 3-isopropylmalate dehydratase small subunit [Nitrospinota bacterium]
MTEILRGKVFRYGRDINTDLIIPARYLMTSDPAELAKHCMEDHDATFLQQVEPGDIIVAEENFGSGSSREHAPVAIKASGISCVIAKTFARIFFRNAINIGLPVLQCPEAVDDIRQGDRVEVSLEKGEIRNLRSGKTFHVTPYPEALMEIIKAGGLMNLVKKKRGTSVPTC